MAKERGLGDTIKAQIMLYPSAAPSKDAYESYKLFGQGDYMLSQKHIDFFGAAYFTGEQNKIGFPLMATKEDMEGLPPALIIVAEADVLRDEGEEYGRRLTAAGVPTTTVRMLGASKFYCRMPIDLATDLSIVHGYATVPVETPLYKQTMAMVAAHLSETITDK